MGRRIAFVGWSSISATFAPYYREAGWDVAVCLRRGSPSFPRVPGWAEKVYPEQVSREKTVFMGFSDFAHGDFYNRYLRAGPPKILVFAHGFSVAFKLVRLREGDGAVLLAPKGIGAEWHRRRVLAVAGLNVDGGVIEELLSPLRPYKVLRTTFEEETRADLLSEALLLCGGLPVVLSELYRAGVEEGVNPELWKYELFSEIELILSFLKEKGLENFLREISEVALVSTYLASEEVSASTRETFDRVVGKLTPSSYLHAHEHIEKVREELLRLLLPLKLFQEL